MPGHAACFRCGSLLEAKAGAIEVHPPRAPAWKKPFRRIARRMRHFGAARKAEGFAHRAAQRSATAAYGVTRLPGLPHSGSAPQWGELRLALRDAAIALALSIVPGLYHAVRHQFGAIRLYVISWFVSLVMGVFFFGQGLGSASMASAFVLHAWIAMDAVLITKRFKEKMTAPARMGWRLVGIAFGVLLLYGAYLQIQRAVGLTIGLAGIEVPAQRVELGDSILCRFLAASLKPPPLKRGDMVLVTARELVYGDGRSGAPGESVGETVGELVALPGDHVALSRDGFAVNGRVLDINEFSVPRSLHGESAALTLGKDEYFVTMEWRMRGHGVAVAADLPVAMRACVCRRPDVLARGVMRWFPFRKRGFLKELE